MEEKIIAEILVVDDHPLLLDGVCKLVDQIPEVIVADAVTSGAQALQLIAKRDYDIYILDISIPDVSGFELIARIRELNAHPRIIVSTMHEEVWIMNRLVQSGVNAVVLKTSTTAELTTAIRCVLQGESYACPRFASITQKLQRTLDALSPKNLPTKRELEVLHSIAKGFNTHEIASLLGISENTVETFRKRLIAKFAAKNGIDMVLKAMSQGWLVVE